MEGVPAPRTGRWNWLAVGVVLGAGSGALWGAIEGVLTPFSVGERLTAGLVEAGLTAPLGVVLGTLGVGVSRLYPRGFRFVGTLLPADPLEAASSFVAATVFLGACFAIVRVALGLQVEAFAPQFAVFAIALAAMGSWVVREVSLGLGKVALQRMVLSNAAVNRLRLGVIVIAWLATGTATVRFAATNAPHLGVFGWATLVVGVGLNLVGLSLLTSRWGTDRIGRSSTAAAVLVFVVCGLLVAGIATSRTPSLADRVEKSAGGERLLTALSAASDFDGDGAGSWFGGGDCSPFDPTIGPLLPEVPDNEVDENCDGQLGRSQADEGREVYSDNLEKRAIREYNVLLVIVDALRADRVGANGSKQSLTPHIDRLAEEAWNFTHAQSQSSSTRIAVPSLLAGLTPQSMRWKPGKTTHQPVRSTPLLQERLKRAGYRTMLVENGWMKSRMPSLFRGFDTVLSVGRKPGTASKTTAKTKSFLESLAPDERFFVVAYYDGPHLPYYDLSKFGVPAESEELADRYAAEVKFADIHVGHLLNYLQTRPRVWKNTIVIVTGDHGEEFQEHGNNYHSKTCYIESVHVPLVVRVPSMKPASVATPVSLVDIVPTVLELTGLRTDDHLDGQSLVRTVREPAAPPRPQWCTYFGSGSNPHSSRRRVELEGWSLVITKPGRPPELYDRTTDPKEQRNVAGEPENTDRLDELVRLMAEHNRISVEE